MKRILKVTGIVVGTVVAVALFALTVSCAILSKNCVDTFDDYYF